MSGSLDQAARRPRVSKFTRWLAGRTLRGRLIAGLLALLALSCALVGVVTYVALRGFLFSQLSGQLTDASNRYVSCVEVNGGHQPDNDDQPQPQPQPQQPPPEGYPPPLPNCGSNISGQAAGTFTAKLERYPATTAYFVTNADITRGVCRLSKGDRSVVAALPTGGKPVVRDLPSAHGDYLLTARTQPGGDVLVTGLPLEPVQALLSQVEVTEAIVFGLALLLTGLIGTAWVRLSLRPLSRMTATATAVTALPLASGEVDLPHRVDLADERTEVGLLGTAFNRMLGHVESALARRHASEARLRSFAADASHELRTPLAAIRGYAQLARRYDGELPEEVRRALERVDAESARMGGLVEDLLLLARLDAGRPLERRPVDLTRLAIDATSDARVAAPSHRWRLDLPAEPVSVPGDEPRLRQVLANLLGNAAKHTPAGSTVTVALTDRATAASGRAAVLSVTDDGPGIPADLQSQLFERFVRGSASRSPNGGSTGLGLSIVDAVVAAHGGRVAVTSSPGQTRFTVTLPAPAESGPLEPARPESGPLESARPESAPAESARPESAPAESAPDESARPESARPGSARPESARPESAPAESARPESARPESAPAESARAESAPAEPGPADSAPADSAPAGTAPTGTRPGVSTGRTDRASPARRSRA